MKIKLIVLLALALASGCATTSYPKVELDDADFAGKPIAVVNDVPFVEQTPNLCGPTALYMAAKPLLPQLKLEEVSKISFTPAASGAFKQDMLAATRRLGLAPYRIETLTDIFDQLARGVPVVVFHRTSFLWKDFWHYSVLTGYNRIKKTFSVHIGPYAHHDADISDLVGSWQEGGSWAYVIYPAGKIPEHGAYGDAIENALTFLRLAREKEAEELGRAALARWPDRYEADVVLAEALMKLDRPKEAIRSLQSAHRKKPENRVLADKLSKLKGR